MSLQWWDATRPDLGYQGTMLGRSDITEGESAGLLEAGLGIGALRETVESTELEVQNQGRVLMDYGEALERKVEPWAVPTVAPLSATINRRADPTFQLSDFMVPLMRGTSDAAGHNHQHTTTTAAFQLNRGAGTIGRTYLAFITPAINRAYTQLNFMVSEVANPPARMDVAIYVVGEDRTLTRQVLAVDAGAGIGLGEAVVSVPFPTWVATQGSYIAVTWLQHGAGNPRSILGLDDTPRPLTNLVFPRKISAIHPTTGMTSLPASIAGTSQVDFGFWFTPYAELSEDIGVELRAFSDGFNQAGYLQRPWVIMTNERARAQDGHVGTRLDWLAPLGRYVAMYDTPLSTGDVEVRAQVRRHAPSATAWSFVAVRASNNLLRGVGVFFNYTRVEIRSWTATGSGQIEQQATTRAGRDYAVSDGEYLTVAHQGGVVRVLAGDGQQLLEWTDTATPEGPAHRFLGIGFSLTGAGNVSPRLNSWHARDLPRP